MSYSKRIFIALITTVLLMAGCAEKNSQDMVVVDNGADAPTLDSTLSQDTQSGRVLYDLFEGLTSFDQQNQPIPGLAQKWEISEDGTTYTFFLRPNLKFSDGTPITADDVVFTWQRLVDPKVGSPYNLLGANIKNGQAIIEGKMPVENLGVTALNENTVQIQLEHPDAAFLAICSRPNVGILSRANVTRYGNQWTKPENMVTSGAYKLAEWVINGYILLEKNPYYYDADQVTIPKIKFLPIVDASASLSQYQAGNLDITHSLPVDQYEQLKQEMPEQIHTVTQEAIYYYNLNMTLPKFKNNPQLRQALSMAVDRTALVELVLGQGQTPLYSYVTPTIENGKFAGLDYEWADWPREKQIATAQRLFKEAGYGSTHPLSLTVSYNTNELHRKIALALASMWQEVFGSKSIQVKMANQEWKTFLKSRKNADYDVARDGWVADYDSVDNYLFLYQCKSPLNNSQVCNPEFERLIAQAQRSLDPEERVKLLRQSIQLIMQEYNIIPLYQYTYFRLVNPRIKGYEIEKNHLDHVKSKWYSFT